MTTSSEPSLIDRAMAQAADAGAFGPGVRFVSYVTDERHTGHDQFASTLQYGTATVRDDGQGVGRDIRLVLKFKHRSAAMRALCANDKQFHNETLFYERIVPFLLDRVPADDNAYPSRVLDDVILVENASDLGFRMSDEWLHLDYDHKGEALRKFIKLHMCKTRMPTLCRYFYGRNDCGDRALDDVIVLENATDLGYRMSDERLHLDYDHLLVALRTLAKFHGLSYRAKHEDPAGFADKVARHRGHAIQQHVQRLAERCGGDDKYERRLRALFLDEPTVNMRRVLRPDEPLAVLCHGDFNRNNLMFRYSVTCGRPVDALPVDMSTVRYGSPALDLSFFLYVNTDRRTRDRHWDALLDVYCAALSASVSDVRDGAVPVPDRARLDAEISDHGIYGLVYVSFFVRFMMDEQRVLVPWSAADIDDEVTRTFVTVGGDRATNIIADAVQHFLDCVCATTIERCT